ncbi:MAG: hypothetical protein ACI9F2_000637 [Lysobacterales bacterium]|jgi:hypothetical protein
MRKFPGLVLALFIFSASSVCADVFHMNDGSQLIGDQVGENSYSYTVDTGGTLEKVFKDQVDHIVSDEDLLLEEEGALEENVIESPTDSREWVIKLLQLNGVKALLYENKQKIMKEVPSDKFDEMDQLFNIEELVEALVPVYQNYYEDGEIEEVVRFYESSAGQKMINSTPQIMQEVMQTSVNFFQKRMANR